MDDNTKNDLKKQFANLPAELQDAISATDLTRKFEVIAKDNKLMLDQAGNVELETKLVLLGLEPLENYVNNLVKNVGLSKDVAQAVANDANELIFKEVRDALKKINEENIAQEAGETAPQNQPSAQPSKEQILSGIENPASIKTNEDSVSMSSLASNNPKEETGTMIGNNIEIKNDLLPEIAPESMLPAQAILTKQEPYHENVSPVENIVQSKMTETVIVPKETIVVEEKTKLPEKARPSDSTDPYREPVL